jgi:uncharacterized sodium:solute symporter family permease YidK
MANATAKTARPWTVTVVIVLAVLVFLEQLFVGILGVVDARQLDEAFDWGNTESLTYGQIVAASVTAIVLSVLGLAATIAFGRGSRSGTIALAVLTVFAIASALIALRSYADFRPALGAFRLVGGIAVLYLLFQQRDEPAPGN